jgi:hypothetical protein
MSGVCAVTNIPTVRALQRYSFPFFRSFSLPGAHYAQKNKTVFVVPLFRFGHFHHAGA